MKITNVWTPQLHQRLEENKPLIQILIGPRQVGKTTSLIDIQKGWPKNQCIFTSADEKQPMGELWIEQHWQAARDLDSPESLLIIDEIQKIPNWSETVKRLWDEDIRNNTSIKVVLSGSSSLSLQSGLTESLAGRFEIVPATHWQWPEFHKVTSAGLKEFIYFGGYPGAYRFINDEARWRAYIQQSIIENILSKDILQLTQVNKPALLRRLFQVGCEFSGQVLSYQKVLGQLQDAGNTTTLAHYLELLDQAFVLRGISKFEFSQSRLKRSSPKFQVHNNALMGALGGYSFEEAQDRKEIWGRYFESCVGTYLVNQSRSDNFELYYWRDRNMEVDFVVKKGSMVLGIEVKSGRRGKISGLKAFKKRVPDGRMLLIEQSNLMNLLDGTLLAEILQTG